MKKYKACSLIHDGSAVCLELYPHSKAFHYQHAALQSQRHAVQEKDGETTRSGPRRVSVRKTSRGGKPLGKPCSNTCNKYLQF